MTDHFPTLADAAHRYRRCRKPQHFILDDDSPDLALPCGSCGRPLNTWAPDVDEKSARGYHGNRALFKPRAKRFVLQHYTCAWGSLLGAICTSYTLAEAGAALAAAEAEMEVAA